MRLQDKYKADVPCLLWCLWLERHEITLVPNRWQQCVRWGRLWQKWVVRPLRSLRRVLRSKPLLQWLRKIISGMELGSEYLQLKCLEGFSTGSQNERPQSFCLDDYLTSLDGLENGSSQMAARLRALAFAQSSPNKLG